MVEHPTADRNVPGSNPGAPLHIYKLFIRLLLLSCDWFIRRLSVSIIESVENWTFYSTGSRFFARLPLAFVIWSCVALVFVSYSYLVPCGSWIPVRMFLVRCPVVHCVMCCVFVNLYDLLCFFPIPCKLLFLKRTSSEMEAETTSLPGTALHHLLPWLLEILSR